MNTTNFLRRTAVAATLLGLTGLGISGAQAQAPAGAPIRVGSTLALTGPLSATAQIHKLAGEIYIEQVNKRGGWLGRPVVWEVKDDQSKPDLARTLYEQLITAVVKRDLPFYSAAISEQSVASMNRYCRETGMLQAETPYDSVVAAPFSGLWNEPQPTG